MHAPGSAPKHLFASYASVDRERVEPIIDAIRGAGLDVWIDRAGIPGGASYGPEIVRAIRESGALLLMCTPAAYASRNVPNEVSLAWKHARPIVPLLLEPADVPDELAYWLESAQWIEVLDRPDAEWFPELLRALERLRITGPPPQSEPVQSAAVLLPAPLTALLGRDAELLEIAALLRTHRLVTLVGPGGVGKTRLAIEAARFAAAAFAGGVVFADLAPVRDSRLVLAAIAKELGVREQTGEPVERTIAGALGQSRSLVVLDNLEQVLDSAPDIAALLGAAPNLVVLATSRAPLAIRGERLASVEPLDVGTLDARRPDVDLAALSPAVALFAERAAAVRPGFAVTVENVRVVTEICARLEGLPLAIELAAARTRLLSPEALLEKMTSRLPLLAGGARDLPDRQRTLRDAIAWSYDLLTLDEQWLFRQLGVFVGGHTYAAAEAVAGIARSIDLFDALGSLVDKSLVQVRQGRAGARYGMLETVREFALEQLAAAGEETAARERHAAWMLAVIDEMGGETYGGMKSQHQTHSMARLDDELANLRAAAGWVGAQGDGARLLRLVVFTDDYWQSRPYHSEVRRWLEAGLSLLPIDASHFVRRHALYLLAFAAGIQGDREIGLSRAEGLFALSRASGDPADLAVAWFTVGNIWEHSGDLHRSLAAYAAAVEPARAAPSDAWLPSVLGDYAEKLALVGEAVAAAPLAEEALALHRKLGYGLGIGIGLGQVGVVARALGDLPRAARCFVEAIAATRLVGNERAVMGNLAGLAGVALGVGQSELAARWLAASEAARVRLGFGRVCYSLTVTRITEEVKAALNEPDFNEAWAGGGSLTLDAAVEEAEAFARSLMEQ